MKTVESRAIKSVMLWAVSEEIIGRDCLAKKESILR